MDGPLRTELHPEVAADVERKREAGGLIGKDQLSIAESRRQKRASHESRDAGAVEVVERVRDLEIPGPEGRAGAGAGVDAASGAESGIDVRVYTPAGEPPFPVLVWFHGGGWIRSSVDAVDPMCRALANAVGCVVVSAGYRLAPEHPFPAALDDAYAATAWTARNAEALGGDSERLAVGGKSAGGTLAAGVAMLARDRDGPEVACQVLGCPALDPQMEGDSFEENVGFGLDPGDLAFCWETYLGRRLHGENGYAAPLRARDLSALPPVIVVTAGYDLLRDDGIRYAERLESEGGKATLLHYPDMNHGLLGVSYILDDVGRAREAVSDLAAELRDALGVE